MEEEKHNQITTNHVYQHFKGNLYFVTGLSINAETDELMVAYSALYGECKKYTRRFKSFTSNLDKHGELIKGRADNVTGQEFCFIKVDKTYNLRLEKEPTWAQIKSE